MPLNVVVIVFEIVVLILAFSVHECPHPWTAWRLGDPTARMLGRVTLNPIKHLDPIGSIVFPLISLVYGGFLLCWGQPHPPRPPPPATCSLPPSPSSCSSSSNTCSPPETRPSSPPSPSPSTCPE